MRYAILRFFLRLFHLPDSSVPVAKPGLLLIQFDGVSAAVMQQAIRRGYCPFLKRLLKKTSGYEFLPYWCGIPSTTTSSEAEIFYGKGEAIPGFSWYDRNLAEFMNGFDGKQMRRLEETLAKGTQPLLAGGSCIMSVFTGGATLTSFTSKDLFLGNPITLLVRFRLVFLLLLHPVRFWSTTFILWRQIIGSIVKVFERRSLKEIQSGVLDTIISLYLNDVAADVARIELLRVTPRLFINFSLYDHLAHIHGTKRPITFSSLRILDSYCRMIFTVAESRKRRYDILILSDHGQGDSVPFDTVKGETIVDFLGRSFRKKKEDIVFGTFLFDRRRARGRIFVIASGNILHLYFSETLREPYSLGRLEADYPGAIQELLTHPGIGWILIRVSRKEHMLLGKGGEAYFQNGRVARTTGQPIEGTNAPRILETLSHFAANVNIGDVVLFGDVLFGRTVAFEPFAGVHSGFTGDMMQPFIITNNPTLKKLIEDKQAMKEIFRSLRSLYAN